MSLHTTKLIFPAILTLAICVAAAAGNLRPDPPATPPDQPGDRQDLAIDELLDLNAQITAANQELAAQLARTNLELERLRKENADLKQFIKDHDEYGTDFEKYAFFREQAEREARARQAAEAKAKREEERQRALDERMSRKNKSAPDAQESDDDVLARRIDMLKRAGFVRVGKYVGVGEMGYSYKTDTRETIHYSPLIDAWYTNRDQVIDYTELTVSGSIIHAASEERNISIAIAFYDGNGAQLGSTTVQVNAARPGVPYPFTATVKMTANVPFKRYSSWVLYDDPAFPPPTNDNQAPPDPLPLQPPANKQPDG